MRETWYVLENGRAVDPADVETVDGRLLHKDGPIAMRPDGVTPMSRSVEPDEERDAYTTREMKPEAPKRAYKTRKAT